MPETIDTLITGIETSKSDIATAIENKGVTVPSGTKLAGMASLINSISTMHGPASSVDGDIAVFSGTSGDTLADSGKKVTDFVASVNGTATNLNVNQNSSASGGYFVTFMDGNSVVGFIENDLYPSLNITGDSNGARIINSGAEDSKIYLHDDGIDLTGSAINFKWVDTITYTDSSNENTYTYSFPTRNGTLGLQVDIVDLTQL